MGAELMAIMDAFKAGGPYVLAAILFYFLREERKEKLDLRNQHEQLQLKILENTVAQVQASAKMEAALTGLKDVLTQVLSRIG